MSRIACAVVPRFSVAALLRAEPELRGCPLVICRAKSSADRRRIPAPRSILIGVSPEAIKLGVRHGMTVAQALVRHANLVVRPLDEGAIRSARESLLDVGLSISPRVESRGNAIYLDILGLEKLFSSEEGVAAAISSRAERVGLASGVGIAGSKATARIAAGMAADAFETIVVPARAERQWLVVQPLSVLSWVCDLEVPREDVVKIWPPLREKFSRLGIKSLGDLAQIPAREVGSRFGKLGGRLWAISSGRDEALLLPQSPPPEFTEGVDFEHEVESIEGLLFVLRGLLDRLVQRLSLHRLSCRGLRITMDLVDGGQAERPIEVVAPTLDVKALAILARHSIELSPPHAAIVGVEATALADRPRPTQLDFFRPAGPSPERLATTLVRLSALCGAQRVGSPLPPLGYRPEAVSLASFAPSPGAAPGKISSLQEILAGRAALRALRPAKPAQVFLEAGKIAYVRASGLGGRAVVCGGPWRIETDWWRETPCRRDYYDVQLSDGGVYRLYFELGPKASPPGSRWFVDGYYD